MSEEFVATHVLNTSDPYRSTIAGGEVYTKFYEVARVGLPVRASMPTPDFENEFRVETKDGQYTYIDATCLDPITATPDTDGSAYVTEPTYTLGEYSRARNLIDAGGIFLLEAVLKGVRAGG